MKNYNDSLGHNMQELFTRYPGIFDTYETDIKKHEGVYDLKYSKARFSDAEINTFMKQLEKLADSAGERVIIHGISANGVKFTHHGTLQPYRNTAHIETSDPNDYAYVTSDISCKHYTEDTEEFEFNHLVEVSHDVYDEIGILNDRGNTLFSKFLFSPFVCEIDPSCLYILDICNKSTGEVIVDNINKKSLLKSTIQVEESSKKCGQDIEGCALDAVSQKIYENIGNFIILNDELHVVSSFVIGNDGTPCAVLGYKNAEKILINENTQLRVLTQIESHNPLSPKHDVEVWSEPKVNNPKQYLDTLTARKKYIDKCLLEGQPNKN